MSTSRPRGQCVVVDKKKKGIIDPVFQYHPFVSRKISCCVCSYFLLCAHVHAIALCVAHTHYSSRITSNINSSSPIFVGLGYCFGIDSCSLAAVDCQCCLSDFVRPSMNPRQSVYDVAQFCQDFDPCLYDFERH